MYSLQDRFRSLRRDFFDIHAAGGGRHEDGLAGLAVDHDAEVEFPPDIESFFDQDLLNLAAFGPVCGVTRVMPSICSAICSACSGVFASLTPPPFRVLRHESAP